METARMVYFSIERKLLIALQFCSKVCLIIPLESFAILEQTLKVLSSEKFLFWNRGIKCPDLESTVIF